MQIARFHRDRRYQILSAYAQDGVILAQVFQGSTDSAILEDFIEQLLPYCGRWPEPESVFIMDNASYHRSRRIEVLCAEAGVKVLYLPPYSLDLNPIVEFFAELKAFIKRNWERHESLPQKDFGAFLEWCVDIVGAKRQSAQGHFRNAGLSIEEP